MGGGGSKGDAEVFDLAEIAPVVGLPIEPTLFGLKPRKAGYQFRRVAAGGGTALDLTLAPSYTPVAEDVGHCISLEVSKGKVFVSRPVVAAAPVREWKESLASTASVTTSRFRVLSYNTMAETWTRPDAYAYCPPYALKFRYRWPLILAEIYASGCHLVCLQEIDRHNWLDVVEPALKRGGYAGFYMSNPCREGCAILFREDRFEMRGNFWRSFNSIADDRLDQPQEELYKRVLERISQIEHHNVLLMALLYDKTAKRTLAIQNTHLYWGPFPKLQNWQTQAMQLEIMLSELRDFIKAVDPSPAIVICGDFNLSPTSGSYQFLKSGRMESNSTVLTQEGKEPVFASSPLRHTFSLDSAYPPTLPFTNLHTSFSGCIDYIWYDTAQLAVASLLEPCPEDAYRRYTALPSPVVPSDHIAIAAEFQWLAAPVAAPSPPAS